MKIGQRFNQLTVREYFHYIDHHRKYTDFNTLGLYRSIIENEKLDIADKIAVREYAHGTFKKAFDFLQLKDPYVFVTISTIGQSLTVADERQYGKMSSPIRKEYLRTRGSNTETSDNIQSIAVVIATARSMA